jgi:hypothetical protein
VFRFRSDGSEDSLLALSAKKQDTKREIISVTKENETDVKVENPGLLEVLEHDAKYRYEGVRADLIPLGQCFLVCFPD